MTHWPQLFLPFSLLLLWSASAQAKSDIEIEKEQRDIADMVHAIDSEIARSDEEHRQDNPPPPPPSMIEVWLRDHLVGVSVASLIEVGALSFKADDDGPDTESPPKGCERQNGRLHCLAFAANGGSDVLGMEVDQPYVRPGRFLLITGVSPKLQYQYAAPIDRSALQDNEDADDVYFGSQNMVSLSGLFYLRTGILLRKLPDFVVTAYGGPRLGMGMINTQLGEVTVGLVSLQTGLDFALIPLVMDAAHAGGFLAVEVGNNIGSYVFSGPEITDVGSANVRMAVGARILFSLQ